MIEIATTVAPDMKFTDAAAGKVKRLIDEEKNPNLKLRIYVSGGGCSGFQYGFTFDENIDEANDPDCRPVLPDFRPAGPGTGPGVQAAHRP